MNASTEPALSADKATQVRSHIFSKLNFSDILQRLNASLDEWLSERNTDTLLADIRDVETKLSGSTTSFVTVVLNRIVERKDKERNELIALLPLLRPAVSESVSAIACTQLVSVLPDIQIDVPLAATHISAALAALDFSPAVLLDILTPLAGEASGSSNFEILIAN